MNLDAAACEEIVRVLARGNPYVGCSSCDWQTCRFCKCQRAEGHTAHCVWLVARQLVFDVGDGCEHVGNVAVDDDGRASCRRCGKPW